MHEQLPETGYAHNESPKISVDSPPAIGNEYHIAKFEPVLNNTGFITSIDVVESGSGYISPPDVTIVDKGGKGRGAEACAVLDRNGQVEEIVVLNFGRNYVEPVVKIISPAKNKTKTKIVVAKANAKLSYAVGSIKIIDGGDGYSLSDIPALKIDPPSNTLNLSTANRAFYDINTSIDGKAASAQISKIQSSSEYVNEKQVTPTMLADIAKSRTKLLPNTVRPSLTSDGTYRVKGIPVPPVYGGFFKEQLPEGFRALDPIFGGVGATPVSRVALSLSSSEYTRLSLAGAISTILVRTLLVPLELIKTKIQLGSDTHLLKAAEASSPLANNIPRKKTGRESPAKDAESGTTLVAIGKQVNAENLVDVEQEKGSVGTLKYLQTLAEMRGLRSLFQSADITFLASLIFGSLGFGTTELFRRTFTSTFYDESTAANGTQTLIFLAAATVACVLTCLVATPFEVLRVKSMARVDDASISRVLGDYMDGRRPPGTSDFANTSALKQLTDFDIKLDFLPLYTSFIPVVTRELPFSITKFLAFDFFAKIICTALPMNVQVGVGTAGLVVSATAGAFAGIAGALVSHPADLLLTLSSGSSKENDDLSGGRQKDDNGSSDFGKIVNDLISQEGGILNLFVGLPARSTFFFFVIGLQFFLYDYAKNLFGVGSDDLNLVLDVFYAVRQGLLESG